MGFFCCFSKPKYVSDTANVTTVYASVGNQLGTRPYMSEVPRPMTPRQFAKSRHHTSSSHGETARRQIATDRRYAEQIEMQQQYVQHRRFGTGEAGPSDWWLVEDVPA